MQEYIIEAKLLWARSVSTSIIDEVAGKTYVTPINEIRGPLAYVYALLVGSEIKNKALLEMQKMFKKAGNSVREI